MKIELFMFGFMVLAVVMAFVMFLEGAAFALRKLVEGRSVNKLDRLRLLPDGCYRFLEERLKLMSYPENQAAFSSRAACDGFRA